MSSGWALAASVVLLGGNAFFVAASFSLVASRRSQVEQLAAGGSRRAKRTLEAMDRLVQMMAGAQLGVTLCSVGLGALAEPALSSVMRGPARACGLPEEAVQPIALALALLVVAVAHVLLGEMVPKFLTLAIPDRVAVVLGPPLARFSRWLGPALVGIRGMANGVLRVVRIRPPDARESVFGLPEVAAMFEESHREGLLDEAEYQLMSGALEFTAARARDVAVPMARLHCLPTGADAAALEDLAVRTRHMRFPVVDPAGRPVGYVHAKDLLHLGCSESGARVAPAVRPMPTISAETPLPEALTRLREAGSPMAVVATPGGPVGVLTLDDVVVALVRSGASGPSSAR
jgi:CBS domain containing-hemolysin-like protein